MYGMEAIMEVLSRTQRTKETLVKPMPCEQDIPSMKCPYSSVDEAPRTTKCTSCGMPSGSLNENQNRWMKEKCRILREQPSAPIWIEPPTPNLQTKPTIQQYTLKPFVFWHPEKNFGISLDSVKCPYCDRVGTLRFKQMSPFRHAHCIRTDVFFTSAIYVCSKGCKRQFGVAEDIALGFIPFEIAIQNPIRLFKKTAWTTLLFEFCIDSMASCANTTGFLNAVARARHSEYLKSATLYAFHVKRYKSCSFFLENSECPPFSDFAQHCDGGFNSSLGPSSFSANEALILAMDELSPFMLRWLGGICGSVISFDHTFNWASRLKAKDKSANVVYSPTSSVFAWMTETGHIGAVNLCKTTSSTEREDLGKNIIDRHQQREMGGFAACGDSCCMDCKWLLEKDNKEEGQCPRVYIDNHHLLQRYSQASPKSDHQKHRQFMKRLAAIITGPAETERRMEEGKITYEKVSALIEKFARFDLDSDNRFVTNELRRLHETQRRHFYNCMPEIGFLNKTTDRCGRLILRNGTAKLESFWRFLKQMSPGHFGLDLGLAVLLMCVCTWNVGREIMFNNQWPFRPISVRDIPLVQYLAHSKDESLDCKSLRFPVLPLSIEENPAIFGLTEAFKKSADTYNPPFAGENNVLDASLLIVETSIIDDCFDPIVQTILEEGIVGNNCQMDECVDDNVEEDEDQNMLASIVEEGTLDESSDDESGQQSNQRKRRRNNTPKSAHASRVDTSHQKIIKKKSRNRYNGVAPLIKMWSDTFEQYSPVFNIVEKNCLRYIAQNVLASHSSNGIEISDISSIEISSFPFDILHKLWNIMASVLKRKHNRFSTYIRHKTLNVLKNEVQKMVAVRSYNWNVKSSRRKGHLVKAISTALDTLRGRNGELSFNDMTEAGVIEDQPIGGHADKSTQQKTQSHPAPVHTTAQYQMRSEALPMISCPEDQDLTQGTLHVVEDETHVLDETIIQDCLNQVLECRRGMTIRWRDGVFEKWKKKYGLSNQQCKYVQNLFRNMQAAERRNQKTSLQLEDFEPRVDCQGSSLENLATLEDQPTLDEDQRIHVEERTVEMDVIGVSNREVMQGQHETEFIPQEQGHEHERETFVESNETRSEDAQIIDEEMKELLYNQVPSLEAINSEQLTTPAPRTAFTKSENRLLQHMFLTWREKVAFSMGTKKLGKVNWEELQKRFTRNCKILQIKARTMPGFPLTQSTFFKRSSMMLKERKKTIEKECRQKL